MRAAFVLLLLAAGTVPVSAQVDGHVSVLVDVLPDIDPAAGSQHMAEFRARVFAERRDELGEHLRITLSGYADGLVADRSATGGTTTTRDAVVRPSDLFVDVVAERFDVRLGLSRIVWGRLDEFQPTDVVNPIDLTRFVLEGRAEARLPVALVRGRAFLPGTSTLEAIVVPAFRAGRFDQLEERTSPFDLIAAGRVPVVRDEPGFGAASLQGGVRFTSTVRRVDWGVSAYRGLRTFPTVTLDAPAFTLRETFPRFTMVGGEFETVRGAWGIRGELAAFVDDELQAPQPPRGVPGRSADGGIGVDRRAGEYRVAANVLWSWKDADAIGVSDNDLSIVVAADRSFARETRTLRLFGVYDPGDDTAFARVIAAVSLRDNTWVEASGGLFTGSSDDTIGLMTRRDFVYARLKVYF